MQRTALLLSLVACAPSAQRPSAVPPAPPPPSVVAETPVAPYFCKASLLWVDPDRAEIDAQRSTSATPDPDYDASNPDSVGAGNTLDDKLHALDARRPDEGVCDTRHRIDLEDTLATLAAPTVNPSPTIVRWDGKKPLAFAPLVTSVLALDAAEQKQLAATGIVVPARLAYSSYTTAYYDVHRGQLPLYVTVDSILHAVHAAQDQYLGRVEEMSMVPRIDAILGAMHCGLGAAAYPKQIADDVDLYLTVARSLFANEVQPSELGRVDVQVQALFVQLQAAEGVVTVNVFGRTRVIDASQFTPRGHYEGELSSYFRTMMWLSRVELNLSSRDTQAAPPDLLPKPVETDEEAMMAVALADLAHRTGTLPAIAELDRAWEILAGPREDVSLAQLSDLATAARITSLTPSGATALRAAIGTGFRRTVNTGPTPSVENLPVVATMFGARVTPDTTALGLMVTGRGPEHDAAELGYMLGHDRALKYVRKDPVTRAALTAGRAAFTAAAVGPDLYSAFLTAVHSLADRPVGATPSFMDRPAFADLRLDSALVAYGQLRHDNILLSAQVYDQGGCEIPDGYVEPAPTTYAALAAYAVRARTVYRALDAKDQSGAGAYYERLEKLMRVLVALSNEELANHPLSTEAKRFLAMIVEQREVMAMGYMGSYPVATFDGWYVDLFPSIEDALEDPTFIADYATIRRDGFEAIDYLGAKRPHLGVFVVDVGGAPRMMVGPVASGFSLQTPLEKRVDDDGAVAVVGTAPWAASYLHAATPPPAFALSYDRGDGGRPGSRRSRRETRKHAASALVIRTDAPLGRVSVELLDHHFVPMAKVTVDTKKGGASSVSVPQTPRPLEAVRVRIGGFTRKYDLSLGGVLDAGEGTVKTPRPVDPTVDPLDDL